MKLIILRGPSGSGKTTIANHLGGRPKKNWFETDMFLVNEDGRYEWSVPRIKQAFASVHEGIEDAMQHLEDIVICSSVNSKQQYLTPLQNMAERHGYQVEIIRTPGPWDPEILARRNEHGVSADMIKSQIKNCQQIAGEIVWSDMSIFK